MHAFMALFFYELVRDQIVFIWHAWATVVVHRWSLFLSAGPCLQHFLDDGENCSYWPSDVKDRFESFIFIYVYLFIYLCLCIYLFVLFDSRSELYYCHWSVCLEVLLCITTSHMTTFKYWQTQNLTTSKDWFYIFLFLINYWKQCSQLLCF